VSKRCDALLAPPSGKVSHQKVAPERAKTRYRGFSALYCFFIVFFVGFRPIILVILFFSDITGPNEENMAKPTDLILGEYPRQLDERFRVSIPQELVQSLSEDDGNCTLAKERPGCLSLWNTRRSQDELDAGMDLVRGKIRAGRLESRIGEVQLLGRLLSTRQRAVKIAGRGRLLIPEGFREFLAVEQGGEVLIVGAAVCVEIWRPDAWVAYLEKRMPKFRRLFDSLTN